MKRRNRKTPGVVAVAAAAALIMSGWNSASAEPTATATGSMPSSGANQPALSASTVTLITGDKVTYSELAGGQFTATIQPDPQSGTRSGQVFGDGDDVYAIPDQAQPLIAAGVLDRELFNVKYLAENGYADDATGTVPAIVQYDEQQSVAATTLSRKADALPATTRPRGLRSINGAAVSVGKAAADEFWHAIRGTKLTDPGSIEQGTALAAGIERVSLDRKATVLLDESVPQVGAPEAWAAGYDGSGVKVAVLDTGMDGSHPDLAGKITASESFIPGEAPTDGHGHGTHVASTITGSGSASNGTYQGVAPGAQLLNGKVLSNAGSGSVAQIIAGMEWAVQQGADIVSMSLGAGPTDGTDPLSQAVNQLSASSDTLFVIAAGNSGPGESTVGAPGAADAALTVAAVDKSDQMANFSSRGPRAGDLALKPDIAAPGVDIVAARSSTGTDMVGHAEPVGEHYLRASGTSMAAPHVSGAVAILAQQHPAWTGQQLKATLMSTSKDDGYNPYEQGAGRVDIARAIRQSVFATTPSADFGLREWPHDGTETTAIRYTNAGDTPVTLQLQLSVTNQAGDAAPGGLLALGAATVTVPAGGTAAVPVTLTESRNVTGRFTGYLTATAGDVVVRTAVAVDLEVEQFPITVNLAFTHGPCQADVQAFNVDHFAGTSSFHIGSCKQVVMLPAGRYMFSSVTLRADPEGHPQFVYGWLPEVEVSGATEVMFDLRHTVPLRAETPDPTAPATAIVGFNRITGDGSTIASQHFSILNGDGEVLVLPTQDGVKVGSFEASFQLDLLHPLLEMKVVRPDRIRLHPVTDRFLPFSSSPGVLFDGRHRLPVVDAGAGTEEDFAGLDVRGKLVLVQVDPASTDPGPTNAAQRGAAGVLMFTDEGRLPWLHGLYAAQPIGIPAVSLTRPEADTLRGLLAKGRATIELRGTPDSPYRYSLKFWEQDYVPDSLTYRVSRDQLFAAETSYRSEQPGRGNMALAGFGSRDLFGVRLLYPSGVPSTRTEYVGPAAPDIGWTRIYSGPGVVQQAYDVFTAGERRDESWGAPLAVPGALRTSDLANLPVPYFDLMPWICAACREGDNLTPFLMLTDGGAHRYSGSADFRNVRVFADGLEVPAEDLHWEAFGFPVQTPTFRLPEQSSTIRVTQATTLPPEGGEFGRIVHTEWQYQSGRPSPATHTGLSRCVGADDHSCRPEPLIFLGYDWPQLGLDNTTQAGRAFSFHVNPYHQEGVPGQITGLTVQASFDDGATWTEAPAVATRDGGYRVKVKHPPLTQTSGTVSLRIKAADSQGGWVKQTVYGAYGLTN